MGSSGMQDYSGYSVRQLLERLDQLSIEAYGLAADGHGLGDKLINSQVKPEITAVVKALAKHGVDLDDLGKGIEDHLWQTKGIKI